MLTVLHIAVSIALIALVLVQERASGLSAVFGGGDSSYHTRRGMEKMIFRATVVSSGLFFLIALVSLLR